MGTSVLIFENENHFSKNEIVFRWVYGTFVLMILTCLFIYHISMETKSKELYERPTMEVVEVQTEGVVCQSVKTPYNPMGAEDDWTFTF